jgi:hypothetical protein
MASHSIRARSAVSASAVRATVSIERRGMSLRKRTEAFSVNDIVEQIPSVGELQNNKHILFVGEEVDIAKYVGLVDDRSTTGPVPQLEQRLGKTHMGNRFHDVHFPVEHLQRLFPRQSA